MIALPSSGAQYRIFNVNQHREACASVDTISFDPDQVRSRNAIPNLGRFSIRLDKIRL